MKKSRKCIFCQKTEFETLFTSKDRMLGLPGEFFVKKCTCGLVFLDPMPEEDNLKRYYPSSKYYAYKTNKCGDFFTRLREYLIAHYYNKNLRSSIIATLIHNVPAVPSWCNNGKILDVGCGSGDTMLLLKKLGWDVYGLDIDKNALKAVRERGMENVIHGTYMDIAKFPDNYFDAIRLYHVIEHLDNPILALKIIYKKLKKNGELIMGTPNFKSITAWAFGKYWLNLDTPRHVILFNPSILQKLLIKEKYTITKVDFCSAGGMAGSIGYLLSDLMGRKIDTLGNIFIVMFFYPLEWVFDKFKYGDVFTIKAKK